MSKSGTLIYKCRLCGELVKNTHVPLDPQIVAMMILAEGIATIKQVTVGDTDIHVHANRTTGITDLVGYEYDEDKENRT